MDDLSVAVVTTMVTLAPGWSMVKVCPRMEIRLGSNAGAAPPGNVWPSNVIAGADNSVCLASIPML